jgi:hypothetical protein
MASAMEIRVEFGHIPCPDDDISGADPAIGGRTRFHLGDGEALFAALPQHARGAQETATDLWFCHHGARGEQGQQMEREMSAEFHEFDFWKKGLNREGPL